MVRWLAVAWVICSGCLTADYTQSNADRCPEPPQNCAAGTVCVVGFCVEPAADFVPEAPRCGDGILGGSEACDDGNDNDDDACFGCRLAVCGDGVARTDLEPGDEGYEACDDANQEQRDLCLSDCVQASCGDGFVGPGEGCDDGNLSDNDDCNSNCQISRCGDGLLQQGVEECDDGNQVQNDACTRGCIAATCGDEIVRMDKVEGEEGFEACDDGNTDPTDGCLNNCALASCGDGFIQAGIETCDDQNEIETDACPNSCIVASCGDGIVREDRVEGQIDYEACDDGNDIENDECTSICQTPRCGDGFVQEGEACDDANNDQTDACLSNCVEARCGDAYVRQDIAQDDEGFEACDDSNNNNLDRCNDECELVLGRTREVPADNCRHLLDEIPGTLDGLYWVDPDGNGELPAIRVRCKMVIDGGGWTHAVNYERGKRLFNAWNQPISTSTAWNSTTMFGLPFEWFSNDAQAGEDLEYMIWVDDTQRGSVYRGVHKEAWNYEALVMNYDFNGFEYRAVGAADWVSCNVSLGRDQVHWNWAIAKMGPVNTNCANYSHRPNENNPANGFLLEGNDSGPDSGYAISGLNHYRFSVWWDHVQVYVRRSR